MSLPKLTLLSDRLAQLMALIILSACSQYVLTQTDTPDVVVVSPTGREYLNVDGMVNWNQPSIPEEDSISRTQRKCKGVWVNGKWIKTQQGWEYISGYCKKKFK